jgi:anaerobic selenocysteine-containing dehydrogenase
VVEADPAYTCAAPADFERALARVPLVVAIATLPSDTALLSDWILPASHALECWDLHTTPPGVPYPLVSLARPALDRPLHDSRPAGEILLELARRLGDPLAAALPWADLRSLAQAEAEGLFHARRGAVMGTPFDEAWVRMMERAGWWAPGFTSAAGLWQGMQETGGWWDPFYDHENWERVLKTASGRFALRPDLLAALEQEIDEDQTTPASGPATRLLRLHLFEPLAVAGGEGAELPFLQELLDPGLEEKWETWVEIHPETAGSLAVADGQWVRVASPRGSIALRARLTDRVEPWVAAIPVGLGHRGGGRWAAGQGANPLELLDAAPDVGRRARALSTTLVTVTPAGRDGSPRREA